MQRHILLATLAGGMMALGGLWAADSSTPSTVPATQAAEPYVCKIPGGDFAPAVDYKARTLELYEKEYLPKALAQLAQAADLSGAERIKARNILRHFVDDWLESYVGGKGKTTRSEVELCLAIMDERFRGDLSPEAYKAYLVWRKNAADAENALAFLMKPQFVTPEPPPAASKPATASAPASASAPTSVPAASAPSVEVIPVSVSRPASRPVPIGATAKYLGLNVISYDPEHIVLRGGFEIAGTAGQWYGVTFRLSGQAGPDLPVRQIEKSWNNLFMPDPGQARWSDIRLSFRRTEFMLLLQRGGISKITAGITVYDHSVERGIPGDDSQVTLQITTNADGKITKVETLRPAQSQPANTPASQAATQPVEK